MILRNNQIRVILAILISQFILVTVLSGVLYLKASENLEEQSKDYYTSTLRQLDRTLEHIFKEVENVIAGVSRDPDLYDYVQLKEDREWIRILRTDQRIDALIAANQSIDSIHIYFEKRGEVLDCKKGLIPMEEFYDRDFLGKRGTPFLYPDWQGPRTLRDDSLINPDDGKKVLTVVKPLGQVSIYSTTFIMVNIPWSYIEDVIGELGFLEGTDLYFYRKGESPIPLRAGAISLPDDPGILSDEKFPWGDGQYLATSWETPTGWQFISLIPEELILHGIRRFLRFTLMISSGALALGLLTSFFLSSRLQEPISRMFRQLNGEQGVKNELAYVNGFILNRLFVNPEFGRETEKDISPIDLSSPYRVMLLSFPSGDTNCWNRSEKFLNSLLKDKKTRGLMAPSHREREIILLINAPYDDSEFSEFIEKKLAAGLTVGISQMFTGTGRVPLAYDQAGRALTRSVSNDRKRIFLFDNQEMGEEQLPATVSFKSESRIKELFRSDRSAELSEFIDGEIKRALMNNSDSPVIIRFVFFQIMRILLECFRERGGRAKDLEDGDWDMLDMVYEPMTTEALREKLNKLMGHLLKGLPRELDIREIVTLKTEKYIRDNISGDLSVETIADNVFVSRSHLSKLFSEGTGITLKDFIDRIRLEKAKELLMRGDVRIQEVGRAVGYDNAQSFIRLF